MIEREDTEEFQRVLQTLRHHGLLLESDAQLPSVVSIITGTPLRGSWWNHPQGKIIYAVSGQLEGHPEAVCAKLISGKITYIHQKLWGALLSVATVQEAWQIDALSHLARLLLDIVTGEGTLQTDQVARERGFKPKTLGDAARELEKHLLVHGESVHTSSGKHTKCLTTWQLWTSHAGYSENLPTPAQGKHTLEEALLVLNRSCQAQVRLPWQQISRGIKRN